MAGHLFERSENENLILKIQIRRRRRHTKCAGSDFDDDLDASFDECRLSSEKNCYNKKIKSKTVPGSRKKPSPPGSDNEDDGSEVSCKEDFFSFCDVSWTISAKIFSTINRGKVSSEKGRA